VLVYQVLADSDVWSDAGDVVVVLTRQEAEQQNAQKLREVPCLFDMFDLEG
jgi:hypothetical protein